MTSPPFSNEASRFLKLSETVPVSLEQCVLSILGRGKYDKSVNTSVILVLCGGCRGTPACGMAAPGGRWSVSSPGEHETGLPANMQTATFISGELLVETARLLAASLSDWSRLMRHRLHSNVGSHVFENISHR